MNCQKCGQPATVHLTDIVNKQKRQTHLCEGCARAENIVPADPTPALPLNLNALLQLLLGQPPADGGPDPASLICPACGLQYAQFRADGRLGCPAEYDAFRPALEPLLERVHRGLTHAGKVPRATGRADVAGLRDRLRAAVAAEQYEEAARLRDRIREREAADEH